MYQLDSTAKEDYRQFLIHYKGVNHIKEVHQKLAWMALLNHDTTAYQKHMALVAAKGSNYHFLDKAAMK